MAKLKKLKDHQVNPVLADEHTKSIPAVSEPAKPHFKHIEFYSRFTDFDISLFKAGKH